MDMARVAAKWQSFQDEMIANTGVLATVHFHPTVSGTVFDSFLKEGVDPNNPREYGTEIVAYPTPHTLSGVLVYDVNTYLSAEILAKFPIGYFEGEAIVFTCRITDATVSGANVFAKSRYVQFAGDPEKYVYERSIRSGLSQPYVYHVLLKHTNIEV